MRRTPRTGLYIDISHRENAYKKEDAYKDLLEDSPTQEPLANQSQTNPVSSHSLPPDQAIFAVFEYRPTQNRHNASRRQTPLRRMALSIEFETNRKPIANTSRLACCRSAGFAQQGRPLWNPLWLLWTIPPVTPQPRVSISGLAAQLDHAGRPEAQRPFSGDA